jgi:hypothetical protein
MMYSINMLRVLLVVMLSLACNASPATRLSELQEENLSLKIAALSAENEQLTASLSKDDANNRKTKDTALAACQPDAWCAAQVQGDAGYCAKVAKKFAKGKSGTYCHSWCQCSGSAATASSDLVPANDSLEHEAALSLIKVTASGCSAKTCAKCTKKKCGTTSMRAGAMAFCAKPCCLTGCSALTFLDASDEGEDDNDLDLVDLTAEETLTGCSVKTCAKCAKKKCGTTKMRAGAGAFCAKLCCASGCTSLSFLDADAKL